MNIIRTKIFTAQYNKLKKKYPKISFDISSFEKNIHLEPFSNLGNGVYKFRVKNSSVPTGKRAGFRIIVLFLDEENIIPLFVYSKNEKENVSSDEIKKAKTKILEELKK